LAELGFAIERLKTGTPPRLHGKTIDYSVCGVQQPDNPPRPFSFQTNFIQNQQSLCYITYTNEKTHKIIRENLDRSPLYSGIIKGIGVRYCPSLEDKIVKFPDRERHQIFLEPEGLNTVEVYANGISTSLPQDVQLRYVRSIAGLEKAEIMRFGYGIEYDFIPPTQIFSTMETKKISGLYFAGQINGTTGYEEAACQGLIAAVNAVLKLKSKPPFTLKRDQAYIGVLIDDLVTRGTKEPYRMFTSRAEYRLLLRHDNADQRLMPLGHELGLINASVYEKFCDKQKKIKELISILGELKQGNQTFSKILRRPDVDWKKLCEMDSRLLPWNSFPEVTEQVEIETKYQGYFQRQEHEVKKMQKFEEMHIPTDLDYKNIVHIRRESREKLTRHQPTTLGQASRIDGVSPADISVLMVYLMQWYRKKTER
jgi:tRNA uridine 5-carboxymethylaminomethyl modification enzyme